MATVQQNSSRAAALARRKAMSSGGKAAIKGEGDRTRSAPARSKPEVAARPAAAPAPAPQPASSSASSYRRRIVATPAANPTRDAALARRKAMSTKGKSVSMSKDRTRDASMVAGSKPSAAESTADAVKSNAKADCGCGCGGNGGCGDKKATASSAPKARSGSRSRSNMKKAKVAINPTKAASLARRKAQSTRGKAGVSKSGMSQAQTARAANPELSSKELALELRRERSKRGKSGGAGEQKARPTGKVRPKNNVGAAQDAPWKVGVSETARGQSVTGTMVGRDEAVTGDEASTCRAITGTEYLGADVFREFCAAEPSKQPIRTGMSATGQGNAVTGNKVGRSTKVTGNEPGTCKNVTGSEYMAPGQIESYCGTSAPSSPMRKVMSETRKGKTVTGDNVGSFSNVTGGEAGAERHLTGAQYMKAGEAGREPAKVRVSETLRGGSVTGTAVGRSEKTTGDEFGACRNITGDDYVGQEQYAVFCGTKAEPTDRKVGASATFGGKSVTGTMDGRSASVTGNEPGTCKAVTGTPYAGVEDYAGFCEAPAANSAASRMRPSMAMAGKALTGQQPGIGGVLTGADKGACEDVTGTPYVGSDQMTGTCTATAADINSSDFPQAVGDTGWGEFSVTAPSHAAADSDNTGVTGSRYEQGQITGPFGMATGKVTGTEDARFGSGSVNSTSVQEVVEPAEIDGRVKSRITGEGMDGGPTITGDDWDRGDRVTGTEGSSALVRNPSMRGPMNAMINKSISEVKNEAPQPVSRVTGSSGNYEGGSLITFSGGARG